MEPVSERSDGRGRGIECGPSWAFSGVAAGSECEPEGAGLWCCSSMASDWSRGASSDCRRLRAAMPQKWQRWPPGSRTEPPGRMREVNLQKGNARRGSGNQHANISGWQCNYSCVQQQEENNGVERRVQNLVYRTTKEIAEKGVEWYAVSREPGVGGSGRVGTNAQLGTGT